jgi:hypothetical protein
MERTVKVLTSGGTSMVLTVTATTEKAMTPQATTGALLSVAERTGLSLCRQLADRVC